MEGLSMAGEENTTAARPPAAAAWEEAPGCHGGESGLGANGKLF